MRWRLHDGGFRIDEERAVIDAMRRSLARRLREIVTSIIRQSAIRPSRLLHRLHPLALPARKHAAGPGARNGIRRSTARSTTATNEDILRGRVVRMAGADEYLRTLAIARLFFDNIPIAAKQLGDDGPEDRPARAVLRRQRHGQRDDGRKRRQRRRHDLRLNEREICRLIRDAGWIPAQRDQYYNVLQAPRRRRFAGSASPIASAGAKRDARSTSNSSAPRRAWTTGADRSVKVQLPILGESR